MKQAFSLVELSIVLVILGLLTGGILAGQSLIRAAELRSVTVDFNKYVTAARSFRDKYFAYPGDMTNAQSFWGTAAACPGDNTTVTTAGVATCNGDGNGQITGSAGTSNEYYRFWQHLANAAMVEGSYTGVANSATGTALADSTATPNVPKSRINSAMWSVRYLGPQAITSTYAFDGNFDNVLLFATGISGQGSALKPEEAWNIDTKLDDGKPGTGIVQSLKNSTQANATTGCSDTAYTTTASIAASSSYLLSNSTIACSLVFKTGF